MKPYYFDDVNALPEWRAFRDSLLEDLEQFDRDILPLRGDADEGKCSYTEYDETYNVWLEALHASIDKFLRLDQSGRKG